jgi:uncharacterized protein (TIGR00730 family)
LSGGAFIEDLAAGDVIAARNENIVAVFGASNIGGSSPYYKKCVEFSRIVARSGISVMTCGGPGIAEAANTGAKGVSRSYGLQVNAISNESVDGNPHIDDDCGFSFNALAMRLLALISNASVAAFFPGGFGTLEELFALLSRIKAGMMSAIPIYLFGSEFWGGLRSWLENAVKNVGAIDDDHLSLFKIEDDVREFAEKVISHCSCRDSV